MNLKADIITDKEKRGVKKISEYYNIYMFYQIVEPYLYQKNTRQLRQLIKKRGLNNLPNHKILDRLLENIKKA